MDYQQELLGKLRRSVLNVHVLSSSFSHPDMLTEVSPSSLQRGFGAQTAGWLGAQPGDACTKQTTQYRS